MLELAAEMIQYQYNKGKQTEKEYHIRYLSVLRERSGIAIPDEDFYKISIPTAPEEGHFSGRFGLGLGAKSGVSFQEIKYRPANHNLVDPDSGYVEGSQIIFAKTAVRYYSGGSLKLTVS